MITALTRVLLLLACLASALAPAPAQAGRNCEARPPTALAVQRGMDLAAGTAQALDATGAQVVVLARAGQDLSKYGLRWSHLALAYRDHADGRPVWRVVHKLNQCGTARADVFRQGLGEFFMDDPHDYAAAIAVPTPNVQARLMNVVRDNGQLLLLHVQAYNMVAYPWAGKYQQSNQWVVETLALSEEPDAHTRERAQAWMRMKGYEPTVLRISPLVRLGARMTAGNVAFDDHPNDKRFSDRIETVTADSVFEWLQRSGLAAPMRELRLPLQRGGRS
jgi:hypothetical protein